MMEQIPIIKPIIEYLFNFSLKIKTVNSNYNNRHYFNIKIPFSNTMYCKYFNTIKY